MGKSFHRKRALAYIPQVKAWEREYGDALQYLIFWAFSEKTHAPWGKLVQFETNRKNRTWERNTLRQIMNGDKDIEDYCDPCVYNKSLNWYYD